VALTINNSDFFSFDSHTQVATATFTVAAGGGQTPVTVYYLRPNQGPIGSDSATIDWSVSDRSCGSTSGTEVISMSSSVVNGSVAATFQDQRSNFGTVFCGAKGDSRTFRISNAAGAGSFNVTGYSVGKGTYYTITPPQGCSNGTCSELTLNPGDHQDFIVSPKMIPPGDISGASDLGSGSPKFTDTFTITTDAPALDNNQQPTGDTVTATTDLTMYAQGVLINNPSGLNTTWNYGTINWSTFKSASATYNIDNQGNTNGVAFLATNTSKLSMLNIPGSFEPLVTQTAQNEGHALASLISQYGILSECTTQNGPFNYTGQLWIVADLSTATNQDLTTNGGLVGICQTGANVQTTTNCFAEIANCAAWVQSGMTFTGTVNAQTALCGSDQCCGGDGNCTSGQSSVSCGAYDGACTDCTQLFGENGFCSVTGPGQAACVDASH